MANLFSGLPDLDPSQIFDWTTETVTHASAVIEGQHFSVTIVNPTQGPINYSFMGEEQIALLPHYQRTHQGYGSPEIRFDAGTGNGTFRDYNLTNGSINDFKWVSRPGVGAEPHTVTELDLFRR